MKKFLLPIAFSAAMFCSGNADAQTIPNWYNFQGVASEYKSAKVSVEFDIKDESGNVVYTEFATVNTTEQGAFTHRLGTGASSDDWMFGIDWTASEYTLVVSINGRELCTAPFGAVPYATVSENLLGFDLEEYTTLATDVKNIKAGVADLWNAAENAYMIGEVVRSNEARIEALEEATDDIAGIQEKLRGFATVESVEALADGLDATQEDVKNLAEGNKENKAAIADLNQYMEGLLSEDGGIIPSMQQFETTLSNRVEDNTTAIDQLRETLLNDENGTIAGINLAFTQLNNLVTDNTSAIETLEEGLATTQEDVINLTEGNKENKAAIADLKSNVADLWNAAENANMLGAVVRSNEERIEALEGVTDDIQGIQETLRGKASVAAVEEVAEGLATTQEDVINLTEGNKENKAAIADLKSNVADLWNAAENANMLGAVVRSNEERIEALEGVTDDIQGIQETLRGKANVSDVTELQEGLENTQQDVLNLTEGNKENKAAIATLNTDVAGLGELVNIVGNIANANAEAIENLQSVTDDIAGIQDKFRNYATVTEVENLAEGLDNTQTDVMNLTTANTDNKGRIAALESKVEELEATVNSLIEAINKISAELKMSTPF